MDVFIIRLSLLVVGQKLVKETTGNCPFACEVVCILGGDPGPQHLVNSSRPEHGSPRTPLAYGSLAQVQGRKKLNLDHLLCGWLLLDFEVLERGASSSCFLRQPFGGPSVVLQRAERTESLQSQELMESILHEKWNNYECGAREFHRSCQLALSSQWGGLQNQMSYNWDKGSHMYSWDFSVQWIPYPIPEPLHLLPQE